MGKKKNIIDYSNEDVPQEVIDYWNNHIEKEGISYRQYIQDLEMKEKGVGFTTSISNRQAFINELSDLFNRYGLDTNLNTPDFQIAEYIYSHLLLMEKMFVDRDKWWGDNHDVSREKKVDEIIKADSNDKVEWDIKGFMARKGDKTFPIREGLQEGLTLKEYLYLYPPIIIKKETNRIDQEGYVILTHSDTNRKVAVHTIILKGIFGSISMSDDTLKLLMDTESAQVVIDESIERILNDHKQTMSDIDKVINKTTKDSFPEGNLFKNSFATIKPEPPLLNRQDISKERKLDKESLDIIKEADIYRPTVDIEKGVEGEIFLFEDTPVDMNKDMFERLKFKYKDMSREDLRECLENKLSLQGKKK